MGRMIFAGMTLGLFMLACSGTDADKRSGGGGGVASSQNAGGSSGASSSNGGASLGGGTEAGASALLGCPTWPPSKLLPLVGPRFYGPDPGQCSSKSFDATDLTQAWEWMEFTYDSDGKIASGTDLVSGAQATYTWADGVLVSYSRASSSLSGDYAETYDFGAGYATSQPTPTSSGSPVRYTLTANGYPLTAVLSNVTTGAVQQTLTYQYDGCRLQGRRAMRADGTALPSGDLTYQYDTAGHIVRRISPNGSYDEYDYTCWTQ